MAKKILDVESVRGNDFQVNVNQANTSEASGKDNTSAKATENTAAANQTATPTEEKDAEPKPRKQRRKRMKRERIQISAYLSPAQYKIVSDMADSSRKNLSDTIGMIIDEIYEIHERRRISSATRDKRRKDSV